MWDAINDGSIYSCPSLLSSFSAICFADLKKYKFSYHFAFPAMHSDPPWQHDPTHDTSSPRRLGVDETTDLVDKVQTYRYANDSRQHGFFLAKRLPAYHEDGMWSVKPLSAFDTGFFEGVAPEDKYVCFVDPSTYEQNPAWMLRNLLVLIRRRFKMDTTQVLCYRDTHARRETPTSIILNLQSREPAVAAVSNQDPLPKISGWERNAQNRATALTVDLASFLDPARLADQAVDLNLRLIKWRIAPSINLDIIKDGSYLLLGAGTLGSYVARNLMGWGARKITFVDNGRVSYSNPVRQPLFEFDDCLNGGVVKADAAAKALKDIYPGVQATGHVFSVPMAGHPITDDAKVKADFDRLYDLIASHDAVFLLMDTRESRWLPTVMAKAAGKIVINAALGFDTYMVMRHGVLAVADSDHEELGCYFCTDVVAPADSLKNTTLDQQCTVTRPGVAPIASALAVELLISVLQSPNGARARAPEPAAKNPESADPDHPLGTVPHQLRGFMSNWQTMTIKGKAYDCCSACSPKILDKYKSDGWDFVRRAISEKGYVEDVSGLAEVHRRAEELDKDLDWDESDDEIAGNDDFEEIV